MKTILFFGANGAVGDLLKAHVGSYTRKDGTFVKEHDDGRQAAAPKPAAAKRSAAPKGKPADSYGHPNVVGHAENLQGGDAKEAHSFHFAGKQFSHSGKSGKSMHDGTPVRHFREMTGSGEDDGEHVWMDHGGRVHADSTSDVPSLRKRYEAHVGKAKDKPAADAKPKASKKEAKAAKNAAESLGQLAQHHGAEGERHYKAAMEKGKDHPDHQHHIKASQLNNQAQYHLEQAQNADNDEDRNMHLGAFKHAKGKLKEAEGRLGS